MTSDAAFVFQGTVVAVGAATLPAVPVDDLTAVVRVDQVLRAPEHMEQLVGREITVRLRKPADPGAVAVFSADGWLYGDSLAVVEVGTRKSPTKAAGAAVPEAFEAPAAADRTARLRKALQARADEASLVVVGRVTGVQALATAAPTQGRLSEHDPHWATATVEVEEAVKGSPPKTVDVLFANSEDVMWRQAPKLALGQTAVMLLHQDAPGVEDKAAHAVIDELDVQPVESAALVGGLSRASEGKNG
jgi:hypothetical protein